MTVATRLAPLLCTLSLALVASSATAGARTDGLAPLGPDFLWGVASSGFQSEGSAPDSNWTRYIAEGRVEDPYLDSVDFVHRHAEDIGRAADLGVDTYRIGIEWARVQPHPGQWDEAAFRFYDAVIDEIRAAGMRPMLTLDHWVYPGWAVDYGGWSNPRMVEDWLANARVVVDRYSGTDPLWVTVNEPTVYVANEIRYGGLPAPELPTMFGRLADAHNTIYDHIHDRQPGAMVTSNTAYIPAVEDAVDGVFLDLVADRLDYIGIDYYYGASLGDPFGAVGALTGQMWTATLQPEGIYYALRFYADKFPGRPLYIVENGMPTENGAARPDGYRRDDLLADTVYWIQRAAADGMNLMGYNYWSITDNYEWGSYTPRFGLYTVDVLTDPSLTRRPTDAVPMYTGLVRDGGVPAHYRPTREPVPCSLVGGAASCLDPVEIAGG